MTDKQKFRFSDEIFVWLTSMGLAVGLAMVIFLIGLVVSNGSQVFWPKRAAQIELKENSRAGLRNSTVLGGEITKRQRKAVQSAGPAGAKGDLKELQLYVGNKDSYGISFKYIDETEIKEITYPKDLLSIERMEYGDALGFPRAIELKSGAVIPFGHDDFDRELASQTRAAADRRTEIKSLEKVQIGAINHEMEVLRLKERSLKTRRDVNGLSALEKKRAELESKYRGLADKALFLRGQQEENKLVYRLMTGEDRRLFTGQIVNYHYPNKINFWERWMLAVKGFWTFLMDEPREANTEGGIFPAIFGTFVMTLLMSVAVTPFGVLAAIYLREYAKQGLFVRSVRIAVNNLAGVPSIVFGVFGLGFFVYFVGGGIDKFFYKAALPTPTFGTGGIFWASLTLALMTVPVVIVATEEALSAVSRGTREGSLACGASKWQTIQHVILPASAPGILTGLILAMARGAGEVAPLMLVGVVKLAPSLPLDLTMPFIHLERKFMHLGFHIYDLGFQSPDSEAAKPMVFATTFLLILLVVLLNLTAIIIRERLRKKYAVGAF